MRLIIALVISCLLLPVRLAAEPLELRIPKRQDAFSVAQDYYTGLLRKALQKAANGRQVPELRETVLMEQGRAAYELTSGKLIDVYWLGTDVEREQQLRAIAIPLDRGLMGYRKFIVRRDRLPQFDAVHNLEGLKTLMACQGLDWPDTRILGAAGLPVREVSGFEHLFQQVVAGRCDYFPRGYFEPDSELEPRQQHYPLLTTYEHLVLHYPFTIYFFVRKDNEPLAKWIEQGLERMIDDGELLAFMKQHPLTAHAFPLNGKNNVRRIDIPNPFLSSSTNYRNSRYWFQPSDFMVNPN